MTLNLNKLLTQESVDEERWGDAKLYQPYDSEQILVSENASCTAVKALLTMLGLEFTVKQLSNAEFMTHGGRHTKLPILRLGEFIVSEFEPITTFVERKVSSLSAHLDEDTKLDMRAYITLVENIFTNAELFVCWMDKEVYNKSTYERYGSVYQWPLNHIQCWRKKNMIKTQLKVYEWKNKTTAEIQKLIEKLCDALTTKLGDNEYFYGNKPTELDALVFGHLFAILTTELPNNMLAETIKQNHNLCDFCKRIEKKYFHKAV